MKDLDTPAPGYFREDDCAIAEFRALCESPPDATRLRFADRMTKGIPVYDMTALTPALAGPDRPHIMTEWAEVMLRGPGVIVLKRAYADTAPIDAATRIYDDIIGAEVEAGKGGGDHFAKPGSNARVWNALQKLCFADPGVFARYFGNPAIAAASEAWVGPNYQVTAQVNLVRPGGGAQEAHRDYHLGFMPGALAARYPAHVHDLSPLLTLQGAIAHCDMPVESGPTKLLPHSQKYRAGYVAMRHPDFRDYFESASVQVAMDKGDALFFNPALFHAAGANRTTDIHRMANLLQVSSPFGRAIEAVDRTGMSRRLYPVLRDLRASGALSEAEIDAAVAASAEGYAFPTNLDLDLPAGGLAPESQATLVRRALDEGLPVEVFTAALDAQADRKRA